VITGETASTLELAIPLFISPTIQSIVSFGAAAGVLLKGSCKSHTLQDLSSVIGGSRRVDFRDYGRLLTLEPYSTLKPPTIPSIVSFGAGHWYYGKDPARAILFRTFPR
jgi:hypothetical protein